MRTGNERLPDEEGNVRSKGEGDTSIVLTPALHVRIRISPNEVAEKTSVRDISWSDNTADLLEATEIGGETTVDAKDLVLNDGTEGQAVEAIVESLKGIEKKDDE